MAVTAKPYGKFLFALGSGQVNLNTATVKMLLTKPGYSPNVFTHGSFDDMSADGWEEVDDEGHSGGYLMGGWTFQNKTWTYDTATGVARLAADPVDYGNITATFRHGIIMIDGYSGPAGVVDFGADQQFISSTFQYAFPDGIVNIAAG